MTCTRTSHEKNTWKVLRYEIVRDLEKKKEKERNKTAEDKPCIDNWSLA